MANGTGDFELEPTKKAWAKETERGEDSSSNIITIQVDSSMPSKYELGATDARGSNVDADLEAGWKQGMTTKEEMAWSCKWAGAVLPISKVCEQVRAVDHDSYTPHYVPIGPYHDGRSSPRIEKEKQRSFSYLESLSKDQGGGLMGLVDKLEPLARACYPDGVSHMTPEELSAMLLCDGCYLLTCLVDYRRGKKKKKKNIADNTAQTTSTVRDAHQGSGHNTVVRDTLFLVENQIPFFLLQKIHERVISSGDITTISALESIAVFVQVVLQDHLYISKNNLRPAPSQTTVVHLLHLLHGYLKPTSPPQAAMGDNNIPAPQGTTGRWRRATEYCKYGDVRFKRRVFKDDEEWTILDVHFQGGTVWVPRLRIDSNTWTILRNLMALEEQIILPQRPVTAYCVFMSQVACKVEDVELLQRQGILEHFLGSDEEVAQGFVDLCKGVVFDDVDNHDSNYLNPIWHKLHQRCESRVHRFMGWFCQFKYIWITIAALVALIVIACQVTQTFYAVSYSHGGQQPKH